MWIDFAILGWHVALSPVGLLLLAVAVLLVLGGAVALVKVLSLA